MASVAALVDRQAQPASSTAMQGDAANATAAARGGNGGDAFPGTAQIASGAGTGGSGGLANAGAASTQCRVAMQLRMQQQRVAMEEVLPSTARVSVVTVEEQAQP